MGPLLKNKTKNTLETKLSDKIKQLEVNEKVNLLNLEQNGLKKEKTH